MRILLVTDWNRGQGGAEAYIARLRDGLLAAGDDVGLLTSSAGSEGDGKAEYVAFGTEQMAAQSVLQIANPFALSALKKAIHDFQPELVMLNMFMHHLSPAILSVLSALPTVLLVSDYKVICPLGAKLLPNGTLCREKMGRVCYGNGCLSALHWLRDQVRYGVLRAGFKHIDHVLACSEWVKAALQQNEIESEVVLLPDARPADNFQRRPAEAPTFLFLGRLDREKGVDVLIRAFALVHREYPSACLRIVGCGPLQGELESLSAELGLVDAVEFCGWQSRQAVEAQLIDPWALVVPSAWAEPLGLVAVEAVTRGVPVIVSESGGLAEIVKPGVSGLYFPNNDVSALATHLRAVAARTVFENHILAPELVAQVAHDFNVERHISLMRSVFAQCIERYEAR